MKHEFTTSATSTNEPGREQGTPSAVRAAVRALRPGTWPGSPVDVTFAQSDLEGTARAYNPAAYRAPVVIGHPKTDAPAWGWVDSARADGEGLWLELSLRPEMAELIREGRYRTVSASLWGPEAAGNPTPGVWSLRHLGYLGATPPAVKGLGETVFNNEESAGVSVLTLCENGNDNGEPAMEEKEKTRDVSAQAVELAERERTLAERESAVSLRERELRLAGYGAEVDVLIQQGRILPAEKPGLVALMERLEGAETVTLSENDTAQPGDVLRGFLRALTPRVDLQERSAPDGGGSPGAAAATKVPDGCTLSERGAALDGRARAIMAAQGCTYLEAARQAEAGL